MKIDVVIPSYNSFELLSKNLPLVVAEVSRYKSAGIIIVDDCSDLEDFSKLESLVDTKLSANIRLLRNEKNLGFSSTVNRGVAQSNADFVVLLNTDVIPQENFLEAALTDLISDKNLFGVGFMDKSIEEGKIILRGRGVGKWEKGFLSHRRGEVDHEDTFWISGGSCIIRRHLFEKFSGFDELYNPFYWEDIDLSYRARKARYSVLFQSRSIVVHKHEEGAIKKYYTDFQVKTIAYRNQFIFVWKNITDLNLIISHFLWLPYHLLVSVLRVDISFALGFFLALLRLPVIIMKRSKQKKFYKIKDLDLLKTQ